MAADDLTPEDLDRIHEDFSDDAKFCRESLNVLDKAGQLIPMECGPAQAGLAKLIKRQRELGKPVRVLVLKARQVWISTYIAARFWRDTVHRSGQHTLVLAQDEETAGNVFSYYQRFDQTYKPFAGVIGVPPRTTDRTDQLDYSNGSWIKFHTAKTSTIGRSFSLRRVHFSEFAFYGDTARQLMGSVMAAVPGDADTEVIVESTANGVGNEFHIMWQRAAAGESDWICYFFAWWEHPEYSKPLDIAPAVFEGTLSDLERDIRRLYNLSLEQLNWRRAKIHTDLNGDEDLFKQEYPGNPEEAFITSGRPRFDPKAITRMPVIRDAIEGALEMVDLGGQKKLLFTAREKGELALYRRPQENREYILSADVAEGIDVNQGRGKSNPDWSVAHVWDRDTGEQVARYRARATPAEFGWQMYMLGVYYFWAGIIPEANGPGLAAIDALLRHNYPPIYIYHRDVTPDQDPAVRSDLLGFKTTLVTRPQMISLLDEALRSMSILIHDPITIAELHTFVVKPTGRAEHQYGCFVPDTTVLLAGNCAVPISTVKSGYSVVTHLGQEKKVLETMTRQYSGPLVVIKASGLPDVVKATPEHPFWAKRWNKTFLQKRSQRKETAAEWIEAKDLKKRDWLAVPKRIGLLASTLTPDQQWAVGFWLAEGHYSNGWNAKPRGLGATNTNREYLERFGRIMQAWFPKNFRDFANDHARFPAVVDSHCWFGSRHREEKKECHEIIFYSKQAVSYFNETFGSGAAGKRIGAELFDASNLLGIVTGFIDGDGSQRKAQSRDVNLYTTSEHLAWQFRQILIDGGVWCTIRRASLRPRLKPSWVLNIKSSFLQKLPLCKVVPSEQRHLRHVIEDDTHFYTPVRAISQEHYDGPVHNFSVEGHNSYMAGGVAVHNCHDDTVIAAALGCVGIAEMPRRKKTKTLNSIPNRRDKQDVRGERLKLM